MGLKRELHIADYVVFCLAISSSLVVGVYYAYKDRKFKTAYRYHRGGGKLKAFPVALSLLVTFESSIFFLGFPAEVYVHGFQFWLVNVGHALGFSCMLWISIPLFYTLQVTSVFEYLQERHNSLPIRQFATVVSTAFMTIYAGIVLFGSAIALESVTDISSAACITAMVVIAVAYTSLGGLKAVVATDVIQGVVMVIAIFAVLIYGTISVGGIGNVIALNKASGRLQLADFDPNPLTRHTFWTLVVGGSIRSIGINFRQPTVQRLNSTRSAAEARKVAYIAIPGFVILQLIVMVEGLVAYAYFSHKGCDPLASGEISNPNQVISFIVLEMFHSAPGVPGLFLAALCCASLSTISSLLSSNSAIISEDILKPIWKNATDEKLTKASKALVIFSGIICVVVALLIGQLKGSLPQISGSILGAIDGPMNGIFIMSIFIKFTTRKGMMTGVFFGLIFALWLSSGYNFSSGRKQTPWLPLGPTDRCDNQTNTVKYIVSNSTHKTNLKEFYNYTTTPMSKDGLDTMSNITPGQNAIHGLDYLYSISYLHFPAMVLFVTLSIGLVVSKLTRPDRNEPVPPHLMLSFREQFLCCVPFIKKSASKTKTYETELVVKGSGGKGNTTTDALV